MIKATIKAGELRKMFNRLGGNSRDLRPALVQIGGVLERASETAFEREGPGWKSLKPATLKARARKGKTGKKLQVDGFLAGSVSAQILGPRSVAIGSNLVYAAPHQFGSPKQGIPAREYLKVGEAEMRLSILIMSRHLLRGV